MILKPEYTKHSEYLGSIIYKRKSGTGSSGGNWLVNGQYMFPTLTAARTWIEHVNQGWDKPR